MNRRLIVHVGPDSMLKGGIASVIGGYKNEFSEFESRGYEMRFLSTISSKPLGNFSFFLHLLCLMRLCLLGRVALVHIHASIRGSLLRKSVVALSCLAISQKYIIHIHSGKFAEFCSELRVPVRGVVRLILSKASSVICLSDMARNELIVSRYVQRNKCCVIYNGSPDFCADGHQETKKKNIVLKILFLGKIIEAKGVYVLLKALAGLKSEGFSFELLVAGNGELDKFNEHVLTTGLSDRVKLLGWRAGTEKQELLRSVDIFVLPSRSEGFSVAVVEAMSASLAIVSTAIPGVAEAIEPEVSGLLVAPDDSESLGIAMKRLIIDADLRRKLGAAARERFLRNFTMAGVVERLTLLYSKILDYVV